MSLIIFLLVLVALIVVHEFGHFVVAKWSGMRVDEFGLGYPPRALTLAKIGETTYTLNWLPFGGFVKIYGEDGLENENAAPRNKRAFSARPRILQALTLLAGIAMNLLFAWVLISTTLALGTSRSLDANEIAQAKNVTLVVAQVLPGSPAAKAGLVPGDEITSVTSADGSFIGADPAAFSAFVAKDTNDALLTLSISRNDKQLVATATPVAGLAAADPARHALGVQIAVVGVVPVSLWQAPVQGAELTWGATTETATGLYHFFKSIVTFKADLSQVSGPIGIAGAVGQASSHGLAALLSITALISINLALINLIPIPALDGGRLLFVLIEAVIRRPIPQGVAATLNNIGFGLLILLMLVVSAHDIFRIFG